MLILAAGSSKQLLFFLDKTSPVSLDQLQGFRLSGLKKRTRDKREARSEKRDERRDGMSKMAAQWLGTSGANVERTTRG